MVKIKPAFMHLDVLSEEMESVSYDMKYQYYFGGTNRPAIDMRGDFGDWARRFVVIDESSATEESEEEKLLGYIGYGYNPEARRCTWLAAISFDIGNPKFGSAIIKVLRDIFDVHHLESIEFYCYADNPVCKTYRKIVKKFGGRQAGYFRRSEMLLDGKLHDTVYFEILVEDYNKAVAEIERRRGASKNEIQVRKSISNAWYSCGNLEEPEFCDVYRAVASEIFEV